VAILTPVAKSLFTELGHRSADEALQVWGGYGFVREYGIEQTVRDSRIAMVYEGTNEIQAVDLVQRKLLDDGGARARALMAELAAEADACRATPALQPQLEPFADGLAQQLQHWQQALDALQAHRATDPDYPLRVADDVLAGVGHVLLAWAWARIARTALHDGGAAVPGARPPAQWLQSATFGLQWLLPQARVHWERALQPALQLPFLAA